MTARKLIIIASVVLSLLGFVGGAQAALDAVSPGLNAAGYPLFYQSGLRALQLCQDGPATGAGPNCFFDPVDLANPDSVALGVGGETFYYLASSSMILNQDATSAADFEVAVEAAFSTLAPDGAPALGEQIVFSRMRIRIDVPAGEPAGNWTIDHPWGQTIVPGDAGPVQTGVNFTEDIGCAAQPCDFSLALPGTVGPFLAAIPSPAGFLGDGVTETPIEPGPGGVATFTVTSPNNVTQTTALWVVQGQLFTGAPIAAPLTVPRATFARTGAGDGRVDVFATSVTGAVLTATGGPNFPAGGTPFVEGAQGAFFASVPILDASVLPAAVTVNATATDPINPGAPAVNNAIAPLSDLVTVSRADYIAVNDILLITAESSDQRAPVPTLTATGFGPLVAGALVVPGVLAPPAAVTVTSASGGTGSRPVNIVTTDPGTIGVTRANFTRRNNRLSVNGRITPSAPGARVVITGPRGPIGSAVVAKTGTFKFNGASSLVAGDTLTLVSDGGAFLTGQTVTVR